MESVKIQFLPILIEIGKCQNWKVSELESVRIGKCQNWKVSESGSVRIGRCQNWKVSELESVRIFRFFKYQANDAFVPNVEFDFVAYSQQHGPIILSAKTSLRERYKQADLEGMMIRQVHRRAKSYLLTLDYKAALLVNDKISKGQVLGLDKVIVATDRAFDDLIKSLQNFDFYEPKPIEVLTSKRLIQ